MSNVENSNEKMINETIEEPTASVETIADEIPAIAEEPQPAEVSEVKTEDIQPEPEPQPVEIKEEPSVPQPAVQPKEAPDDAIAAQEKEKVEAENKRLVEEKQKQFDESFAKIKQAHQDGVTIKVQVKDRIKGGLRVMFDDIPIFLPTSHFSLRRNPGEEELTSAIGTFIDVHIHELIEDEDNRKTVIVSRKKVITEELWSTIKVGDIVEGTVSSVASFGIFLDLGGLEGLIHISRLSQVHVADTKTIAKRGDRLKAVVVEINREKNRIALSRKELEESPWKGVNEKYPSGSIAKGIVRRFTDFGAYVEVSEGIDGLLRVGEMSWTKRIKHPSELLNIGDEIDVHIMTVSEEKHTLHLSIKRNTENPWETIKQKYDVGTEHTAVIKQVMTQGCVASLNDEVDGFMPRSKMRQLPRGKKIPYTVGESVVILVSDVTPEQESMIIEPKLDEKDIFIENQDDRRESGRSGQPRNRDDFKPAQTSDVKQGSFSFEDLLPDNMKDTLMDQVK